LIFFYGTSYANFMFYSAGSVSYKDLYNGPRDMVNGPSGKWAHVAFTLDCLSTGCPVKHYIEGSFVYSYNLPSSIVSTDSGTCAVGDSSSATYFKAANLVLYGVTLSATEISAIHQLGTFVLYS
jgi:hypothetical protein